GGQAVAQHERHISARLARGYPYITVNGAEEIETLILAIDQRSGRRKALQQQLAHKFPEARMLGLPLHGDARPLRAAAVDNEPSSGPAAWLHRSEAAKQAVRLGDRVEKIARLADRLRGAKKQESTLAQRKMEQRQDLLLFVGLQIDQQVA